MGSRASASENLDQDIEQMRSEGKGRRSGTGKWQRLACVYVCGYMAWGI